MLGFLGNHFVDVSFCSAMLGLQWFMLCVSLPNFTRTPDREVDARRSQSRDFTALAGVFNAPGPLWLFTRPSLCNDRCL